MTGCLITLLTATSATWAAEPPRRDASGDSKTVAISAEVAIPATSLPFSAFASPQARAAFEKLQQVTRDTPKTADPAVLRDFYERYNAERLVESRRLYRTRSERTQLGGVNVDIVVPAAGIPRQNASRVLINLHGGGFMWGAGSGMLIEAEPIAAVAKMKVVSIDYRMAPEYRHPAGVEDVEAVYRELLKQYTPSNIGIYGCSAGGVLAAQATARMLSKGLPRPGAIATLCGTGLDMAGDSATLGQLAVNAAPLPSTGMAERVPYFSGVAADDPLVFPGNSPQALAKFPPTLLLGGSRDFSASALSTMQRRLAAAGVDAQLVLFDGMWHAFLVFPELPESQEAYAVIARFFDQTLGHSAANAAVSRNGN